MKDLLKLYSFESVHDSDDEQKIFEWICKWLDVHGIVYYTLGKNIYNLDDVGGPILSAHLDQVKTNGKAVKFFMKDGIIRAYNKDWEQTSLGADDKNGIWIILKLLEDGIPVNFIISSGEEVGCVGIKELESNKVLDQIITDSFCMVLDRRGNFDTLTGGGGSVFNKILSQTISNFTNYFIPTTGSISDTVTISKYCESTNLSVAYFNPHTATENTDFEALKNIKDMVQDIIQNMMFYPCIPTVYQKSSTPTCYNYYNSTSKWRDNYEY